MWLGDYSLSLETYIFRYKRDHKDKELLKHLVLFLNKKVSKVILAGKVFRWNFEEILFYTDSSFSRQNPVWCISGYWRGNGANIYKIVPEYGIRFLSYETYKRVRIWEISQRILRNFQSLFGETNLGPLEKLTAGALAGATSQFSIYPMEVKFLSFSEKFLEISMRSFVLVWPLLPRELTLEFMMFSQEL